MKNILVFFSLLPLTLSITSMLASAAEETQPKLELSNVDIHAFISQGYLLSTTNRYLADSKQGSFEFSEAGINFTKSLGEKLRMGVQLFARDLGPIGNYSAKLDWFYLDYRPSNLFGIRAGRVKIPFGLYNDMSDVDSARVPVLLPQSVYPIQNRDYLLAQTGVELYGYSDLGAGGALDYRVYTGTIFLEINSTPGSPYEIKTLAIPFIVGGRLLWESPIDGLRIGGSVQALRLDTEIIAGTSMLSGSLPITMGVASIEYVKGDLLIALEYSRWYSRIEGTIASITAASGSPTTTLDDRAYLMASYRLSDWLHPGIYYSVLFPNIHDRGGREDRQHDLAATMRFDITRNWIMKLEGHYMSGTAVLSPSLNKGVAKNQLEENWGFFLAKTTVYF